MAREKPKNQSKREGAFNSPFKQLAALAKERAEVERARAAKAAAPPPRPRATAAEPPLSESELFEQAMAGAQPLRDPRGRVTKVGPQHATGVISDEAEAMAQLADLVAGKGSFDISNGDEFLEGAAPGVNHALLAMLRRGDFALQGHLDLHGATRAEAHERVERFLAGARAQGHRCVLLIHGRGLNSKDQFPVLKEQLNHWLRAGRLARDVLAFATARPHDGGAGALYVLLRK